MFHTMNININLKTITMYYEKKKLEGSSICNNAWKYA